MNNIEECKILIVDDEIQLLYMVKEIHYVIMVLVFIVLKIRMQEGSGQ